MKTKLTKLEKIIKYSSGIFSILIVLFTIEEAIWNFSNLPLHVWGIAPGLFFITFFLALKCQDMKKSYMTYFLWFALVIILYIWCAVGSILAANYPNSAGKILFTTHSINFLLMVFFLNKSNKLEKAEEKKKREKEEKAEKEWKETEEKRWFTLVFLRLLLKTNIWDVTKEGYEENKERVSFQIILLKTKGYISAEEMPLGSWHTLISKKNEEILKSKIDIYEFMNEFDNLNQINEKQKDEFTERYSKLLFK